MKTLITGGGGFLGQRLAARLLAEEEELESLTLADVVEPGVPAGADRGMVTRLTADITDPQQVSALMGSGFDAVYHLAAVVSAAAEADFDLGMRVNVDGTRNILEACRRSARNTRVVFTSSIAVYGGERVVRDDTPARPLNSYGAQKTIGEYLITDYTRKGFVDGLAVRLPTVVVRPGKPNRAASSFASSIIREPLSGQNAVCPVPEGTAMILLSPRGAVTALHHALRVDGAGVGVYRVLQLPGIRATVGEMLASLREIAGDGVTDRVSYKRDPAIEAIVGTWPEDATAERARALGFTADTGVDDLIQGFIRDEMGE